MSRNFENIDDNTKISTIMSVSTERGSCDLFARWGRVDWRCGTAAYGFAHEIALILALSLAHELVEWEHADTSKSGDDINKMWCRR